MWAAAAEGVFPPGGSVLATPPLVSAGSGRAPPLPSTCGGGFGVLAGAGPERGTVIQAPAVVPEGTTRALPFDGGAVELVDIAGGRLARGLRSVGATPAQLGPGGEATAEGEVAGAVPRQLPLAGGTAGYDPGAEAVLRGPSEAGAAGVARHAAGGGCLRP
jgi:hypothetical protein